MSKPIGWHIESERELWRAICSPGRWHGADRVTPVTHPKALWWFTSHCWGVHWYLDSHPEHAPWFTERVHGPFVDWLQEHLLAWKAQRQRGSKDRCYLAVVLPRSFGKTIIASKTAMIWCHLDEPDLSTLLCSATSDLSTKLLDSMIKVMDGTATESWFSWLYGDWRSKKSWSKHQAITRFRKAQNLQEASFDVTGVDIGMTGFHHAIHVWDDPIIKNKLRDGGVYMVGVHDAVNASYNALQPNGLMMFVLTRYLDDDVAGRHWRDEGVASWTGMECPSMTLFDKVEFGKGIWHVYFLQTEDELTATPVLPEVYDTAKIKEHKSRDADDFACQQQNNPGSGDTAPLVESQLPSLYVDYETFRHDVLVEASSVHIDTAFKRNETVRKGDDNAIVVWHHDARGNGILYLDTDLLRASNAWRAEEFNDKLIEVMLALRRQQRFVKALTDEVEPGGKQGSYKNQLYGILRGAGIRVPTIYQFNRSGTHKRDRIRVSAGFWAEGYVRVLLHKDAKGNWIVPPIVRKLFAQIVRVSAVAHDDLADAQADGFAEKIWRRPTTVIPYSEDGAIPRAPFEDDLKALSRPLTNDELREMIDENKRVQESMGPGHGWENDESMPLREPV